jgi:hypothetical protein
MSWMVDSLYTVTILHLVNGGPPHLLQSWSSPALFLHQTVPHTHQVRTSPTSWLLSICSTIPTHFLHTATTFSQTSPTKLSSITSLSTPSSLSNWLQNFIYRGITFSSILCTDQLLLQLPHLPLVELQVQLGLLHLGTGADLLLPINSLGDIKSHFEQ